MDTCFGMMEILQVNLNLNICLFEFNFFNISLEKTTKFYFADVWENSLYNEVHFIYKNSAIISEVVNNNYIDEKVTLQNITILGVNNLPRNAWINDRLYETFIYNKTENVSVINLKTNF